MKAKEFKSISGCILIAILATFIFTITGCGGDEGEDDAAVFTVTFDAGGGTPAPEVQKVEAGGTAIAPAVNPAKSGYVFLFWRLSGATTAYNFDTPVTGNITLQAKWEEEAKVEYWQVAWEMNGGAWPASGDNHATRVVKGGTLAEPGAPTKTGFTFDGWYKDAELTGKVSFPYNVSSITGDFTLYAKWEDASKAAYFGTWRNRNAEWEQWAISADEIVMTDIDGYGFTVSGLTWAVIYDPNNHGQYPADYTATGILKATNAYGIPKADDSGKAAAGDRITLYFYLYPEGFIKIGNFNSAEHEAFYGPYDKKTNVEYWQVTWELNGGAWPANDNHVAKVAKDGKVAPPANPAKKDNNFDGWYKESALTNKVSFPYDAGSLTNNITLYAKWNDASPSVTLNVSVSPGGGFYASITAMRVSSGSPSQYSIPTGAGTHAVKVSPGTYRIFYSYWACQTVNCLSSGYSSNFTVSSGQTKNISLVGSAVGL